MRIVLVIEDNDNGSVKVTPSIPAAELIRQMKENGSDAAYYTSVALNAIREKSKEIGGNKLTQRIEPTRTKSGLILPPGFER